MKSKRDLIWKHNSFQGSIAMASQNMNRIIMAETTTEDQKEMASQIQIKLNKLAFSLRNERVGP